RCHALGRRVGADVHVLQRRACAYFGGRVLPSGERYRRSLSRNLHSPEDKSRTPSSLLAGRLGSASPTPTAAWPTNSWASAFSRSGLRTRRKSCPKQIS